MAFMGSCAFFYIPMIQGGAGNSGVYGGGAYNAYRTPWNASHKKLWDEINQTMTPEDAQKSKATIEKAVNEKNAAELSQLLNEHDVPTDNERSIKRFIEKVLNAAAFAFVSDQTAFYNGATEIHALAKNWAKKIFEILEHAKSTTEHAPHHRKHERTPQS